MLLTKEPVRFDCPDCGGTWLVPPHNGCPCGSQNLQIPEDYVWEVGEVLPKFYITAGMRDMGRFQSLTEEYQPDVVIDIAGPQHYNWRPRLEEYSCRGILLLRHDEIEDHGGPFTSEHLQAVVEDLKKYHAASLNTILHCSAGLRRAPHFAYAYLRYLGHDPVEAWDRVERARTRAFMHTPYIESVERWLSSS